MTPEERKRLELELELLNLEKEKALATQARPKNAFLARGYDMAANAQATPSQMRASLPGKQGGADRLTNREDTQVIRQAQRVAAAQAQAAQDARLGPVKAAGKTAAGSAMSDFSAKFDTPKPNMFQSWLASGPQEMGVNRPVETAGIAAEREVFDKAGVMMPDVAGGSRLLNSVALGLPAILNEDFRATVAQAGEDQPGMALFGDVVGMTLPLTPAWNMTGKAVNSLMRGKRFKVPFTNKSVQTPNLIPTGADAASRTARYVAQPAGQMTGMGLQNAAVQAGIYEPIRAEQAGEDLTPGGMGKAALAGLTDPINAAPAVFSGINRTWNTLTSGIATPQARAAQMANQYGVGPRQTAASQGIAQTAQQFGGQIRPQDIRGLTNIENALRFALKDVRGIPNINARIADGFQRIRQSLPFEDDPTMNLARLIEREFSQDAPQTRDIIRRFLNKVGLDSSAGEAIVGGAANQIRGSQADVLQREAMSVFGDQPKQEAKEVLERNLDLLGEETYAPIVRAATSAPAPAQQRAAGLVNRRPEADDILFNRADREGLTVEDYIARNPLEALHWVQSDLAKQARALRAANNPDTALEGVIQNMKTVLRDNVPNYREADALYASNARALGRLGTTRGRDAGVEGELKYDPGFGEGLLGPGGAAGRTEGRATAANVFEGMDEQSRRAAAISVRDVILDDLSKARAAGEQERYEIAAKFGKLNSEGALQALIDVFGDEGRRIVGRIRQFVDANEFARNIDPLTGSNTMNKATNQQTGAQPFAGPMGQATQSAAGSLGQNAVGDVFMMASGITSAPVLSAVRFLPWLADRLQTSPRTQRNIAETLLRRGQIGSQVPPLPAGPGPIRPLDRTGLPGYRPPGGSAPPQGNPPTNGVHASIMSGLMPSRPPSFVSAPGQGMRSALAGGATPLPGPGSKLIPPAPAVGSATNQGATPPVSRVAADPAKYGVRPEQVARVNPIYQQERLPPEKMKSNQDAALWLESNYNGQPINDMTAELTPNQVEDLSDVMAAEVQLALETTGNAVNWYTSSMEKALATASRKYRMLSDDASAKQSGFGDAKNARFVFTFIKAITSQNLDVEANVVATDKAFAAMIDRVRDGTYTMPKDWGTGDKQKAMGLNFEKFGGLIDAMPGRDFPEKLAQLDDVFRRKMTVAEWEKFAKAQGIPYTAPGQTAKDAVVYGSSVLGPKIGNGFWQNLNGNYDPLTIDLWKRRTWGRLTGKSIGNPEALPEQRARLAAAIKRSRGREQGKPENIVAMQEKIAETKAQLNLLNKYDFSTKKAFEDAKRRLRAEIDDAEEMLADIANLKAPESWKPEYNKSDVELLAYAKRLLKVWDVEYKRLRGPDKKEVPAELQPTWARAAKTIITNLAKPLDQVSNATQRRQIEMVTARAIEKLAARGIDIKTADLQAALWYPEKELWRSLTDELDIDADGLPIPKKSDLNISYDTAWAQRLKEQGYEIPGAESNRGGRGGAGGTLSGPDVQPQRPQDAEGVRQSGAVDEGQRSGRRTVGKSKKPSKIGTRTADAAAITTLAVGGPIAEADTEDPNKKKLAELAQLQTSEQAKVDEYEQALKAFQAMSVMEKQQFLKDNGFPGKNGKDLVIDGVTSDNTRYAIEAYTARADADIATAKAERDKAKTDANRLEVAMAMKPQKETNPLIDKAQEMATYGAMIYGAHRLRKMGLNRRQGEADKVAAKANALLTRLPVPPEPPRRTLYSRVPKLGEKQLKQFKSATTATNKARLATEERLAGRYIPPISSNPTSVDGLPNRLANVDEFDRQAAAGDFGPVSRIGRFMEPVNSRFTGGDLSLIGGGMADAYIMQGMLDKTRAEIKAEEKKIADEQLKDEAEQSAALISNSSRRLEQLRTTEQVQIVLQRVGIGLAIGGTVALGHGRYARPQPRYEAAARERDLINRAMAPPPPAPPTSTGRTPTPSPTKPRTVGKPKPKPPVSFTSGRPRKAANDNN